MENLPVPRVGQLGYQCVVSVEGATMLVDARVTPTGPSSDPGAGAVAGQQHRRLQRVVCEPTVYRYESSEGEYEARVTLVWNRDHVVDARPLTLYKCGVLGAHRGHHDCSLCVTRPSRYNCAWCGAACRYAPHCPASAGFAAASSAAALPSPRYDVNGEDARLSQCPTPRIDLVSTVLALVMFVDTSCLDRVLMISLQPHQPSPSSFIPSLLSLLSLFTFEYLSSLSPPFTSPTPFTPFLFP